LSYSFLFFVIMVFGQVCFRTSNWNWLICWS